MIDLHLHSTYSDGSDSPLELIDLALALKLKAIALTDHDTINGIKEFISYGEGKSITLIPGIEISIKHEPKREIEDVHILGLNLDYTSVYLNNILKKQIEGRIEQKRLICKRLREEFGYKITFEEVKVVAGTNSIGRPHIVNVLIKNNPDILKEKSKDDLFKMIGHGGEAYVFREFRLNFENAIELIESAGGIPIIAHPGIYNVSNRRKFITFCVTAGIKGIEIEYTYAKNRPFVNTDKAEWAQDYFPQYYRKLANNYNLIRSGGSDYHGKNKNIEMGEAKVPNIYLKNFKNKIEK